MEERAGIEADADASAVDEEALVELGGRRQVGDYVGEIWDRREFAVRVPMQDLRVQNIDTVLGQFWQLLNPAFTVAVYFLVFGVLLEVDRGVSNYLGFLVIGVLLYSLLNRVTSDALRVIDSNEGLIRSVQFPRAVLPISVVVLQTLAFLPSAFVLMVTLLLTGESPNWRWLLFPAIFVLLVLLMVGGALVCGRAGAGFRDLTQIQPHVFRVLFYLSGVIFAVDAFVEDETLRRLFSLNPIYDVLTLARWSLMGLPFHVLDVVALIAWALCLPVVGIVYFARAEHRYGG